MKPTAIDDTILKCLAQMAMLKYFPTNETTQAFIGLLIRRMASTPEQVLELTSIVLAHYNEWPGPMELRAIFCTFAQPADRTWASLSPDSPFQRSGPPDEMILR